MQIKPISITLLNSEKVVCQQIQETILRQLNIQRFLKIDFLAFVSLKNAVRGDQKYPIRGVLEGIFFETLF